MKRLIVLMAMMPFAGQAQSLLGGKNAVKVNLSSLAFGNYHFTYERSILKKLSISISYRTMPKRNLPLEKLTEDYIDDPNLNLGRFEMGNTAITPELRLYLGAGRMKGFYIAPYARFASFDFTVPVKYQSPIGTKDADFAGKIKSTSGGIMFGVQHTIFKKLLLDIWILGGHYGSSSGDLVATFPTALTPTEQSSLRDAINGIDVKPFEIKGTVDPSGKFATIQSDGPWAGIRALGLSLGFKF